MKVLEEGYVYQCSSLIDILRHNKKEDNIFPTGQIIRFRKIDRRFKMGDPCRIVDDAHPYDIMDILSHKIEFNQAFYSETGELSGEILIKIKELRELMRKADEIETKRIFSDEKF
jgi:hypothetical protein